MLNVVPSWSAASKNVCGECTCSESRRLNASSPSGSWPRSARSVATAYGAPLTVTVPLTGPYTDSLK